MNSKIEQTANSIKSEVSEVYQPKGDYATNSSVQSAIEQSATSITSTVSKTYATKTSVDTLQNIADNAIESWYLVGVPSGTNKPASDWTTDTLKKQHVGDMYYDKDTGYSYRWLQEGMAYKWVRIKDNDITNANAVANEAKSTAKSAESTANTAKSTADNASATASAASTKANDAATDAAAAKSDASTAKTTANAAKSTADQAQAGVESLTTRMTSAETKIEQNSEAISLRATKTEVTEVKNTADAASKAATTASTNASNAVDTATTAKNTADAASNTASTANKTANTAKSTADAASKTASTANATANTAKSTADDVKTDLETNYSTTTQMNSAIDLKADSITSTVSKTYQVKGDYAIKSEVDQTIEGVETKITAITNTANEANSTANAAKTAANTLETLIRQSGDGVEVAKKVNGAYTSTKTLMSDDGVHIQDQSNNDLASFTKNKIQLGKNSRDSIIELCDGNGRIKSSKTNYIQLESDGLASLQSARDNGIYSGIANVFAQAMPTNQDCYSYIGLEVTSKKSGSGDSPGAQISLESTKTDGSQVSSINLMADSMYFSNSHSTYGQISMENVRNSMLVAQGISGNWYYRKWASGYAECWGFFPYSFTEFRWWTSQSYVKYTYPAFNSVSYPFTFKEEPALYAEYQASAAQSGIAVLGYNNPLTTSTGEINIMIPDYGASGSGEGIMYIHAFGEYKW